MTQPPFRSLVGESCVELTAEEQLADGMGKALAGPELRWVALWMLDGREADYLGYARMQLTEGQAFVMFPTATSAASAPMTTAKLWAADGIQLPDIEINPPITVSVGVSVCLTFNQPTIS